MTAPPPLSQGLDPPLFPSSSYFQDDFIFKIITCIQDDVIFCFQQKSKMGVTRARYTTISRKVVGKKCMRQSRKVWRVVLSFSKKFEGIARETMDSMFASAKEKQRE